MNHHTEASDPALRALHDIRDALRQISACLTVGVVRELRDDPARMEELDRATGAALDPIRKAMNGKTPSMYDLLKSTYWDAVRDVIGPSGAAAHQKRAEAKV